MHENTKTTENCMDEHNISLLPSSLECGGQWFWTKFKSAVQIT